MINILRSNRFCLIVILTCVSVSCGRPRQVDQGVSTSDDATPPTNRINIPPSVQKNLGITFARIERRPVRSTSRFAGQFELKPDAIQEYGMLVPGHIRLEVRHLDSVVTGQTLFQIQSPEWFELLSQIDLSRAGVEHARARLEAAQSRLNALEKNIYTPADLRAQSVELTADLRHAEARLETDLQKACRLLNAVNGPDSPAHTPQSLMESINVEGLSNSYYKSLEWIPVKALKDGLIDTIHVTSGSYLDASTPVVRCIDPEGIRFKAVGLQDDLDIIQNSNHAFIVRPQSDSTQLNEKAEAEIVLGYGSRQETGTVDIYATVIERCPWARPGLRAFLEVWTDNSGGPVLAVPRSAIIRDGLDSVFFKKDPANPSQVIRTEADMGAQDGRWVELKSGVGPNDEVVLNGAYELKLASEQNGLSQKGGHFHADGSYHGDH